MILLTEPATKDQVRYLTDLMRDLGYDEQDLEIDLSRVSKTDAGRLISELAKERGDNA